MTGGSRAVAGKRLRDRVYDSVRDMVECGKLAPGQRLTEADLALRFSVSRTPVREALFQLAREGLLEPLERGYGLPAMPAAAVLERLNVKRLLDPVMAAQVAHAGPRAQIEMLSALTTEARSLLLNGSLGDFACVVHRFQKRLTQMCTNAALGRCCEVIEDDFIAARAALFQTTRNRVDTLTHLCALVGTFQREDAEAAELETRHFIGNLMAGFAAGSTALDVYTSPERQGPLRLAHSIHVTDATKGQAPGVS